MASFVQILYLYDSVVFAAPIKMLFQISTYATEMETTNVSHLTM